MPPATNGTGHPEHDMASMTADMIKELSSRQP